MILAGAGGVGKRAPRIVARVGELLQAELKYSLGPDASWVRRTG
jgi:hypothetical protein